ncbi:E3 ubiquitin/ISG15 ligase TRIM25-like [Cololabis saira]|uniref:E3 ubiquitin/ISG15 ligase TRIM25-like n=1 Tax=Cololabis saira TaxID=129043 RepID=UPI002AD27CCB|nr:E3 ubiquitin/ISG15 ligase TRIM25-like [Cololabis saira]
MFSSKPEEQLSQELSCPICLQLYLDPVVLPCGHNYCRACISKSADPTGKILPRCPECREEYQGVGSLQRNFKLCNIIEGYRATAAQLDGRTAGSERERKVPSAPLDSQTPEMETGMETEMGKATVFCDHCIDEQTRAAKTCLKCEVSLCSRHLQRHHEKESFRLHAVVEPQNEVRPRSCPVHFCPLEYFCSDDMSSLCTKCFVEGHHKNHDVLTFSVAEEEMRRALETRNKVIFSRLQLTESLLKKTVEEQGASEAVGDKMVNKAASIMDNMAALVDRYRERLHVLLEEERGQHRKSLKFGVSALEDQQQQLLDAHRSATKVLAETDTFAFINSFMMIEQKLREVVTGSVPNKVALKPTLNTKRFQTGLKTQDFRSDMSLLLDSLHVLLNPLELTFNVCTTHPNLLVSSDLRTVRCGSSKQPYVEHSERFTTAPQVMCSQSFSSGEHVWVVEVGTSCMWSVGVCYKSIPRRGDHSRLGHNSLSWRLQWKNSKLTVCTGSSNVALGEMPGQPVRIEVALDYEGGTLTFHSVKGRREHLYTFRAAFKEPLFPAFSIHSTTTESWITLHNGV